MSITKTALAFSDIRGLRFGRWKVIDTPSELRRAGSQQCFRPWNVFRASVAHANRYNQKQKDCQMTISRLRTLLYLISRFLGDVRAVQSGRIVQRIGNRLLGHMIGKITRPLWFR